MGDATISGNNYLWDGKVDNREVSPGTYAYYLEVTDETDQSICPIYGDVTLIR